MYSHVVIQMKLYCLLFAQNSMRSIFNQYTAFRPRSVALLPKCWGGGLKHTFDIG